jgi:hypothetical protein
MFHRAVHYTIYTADESSYFDFGISHTEMRNDAEININRTHTAVVRSSLGHAILRLKILITLWCIYFTKAVSISFASYWSATDVTSHNDSYYSLYFLSRLIHYNRKCYK